MPDGVWLFSSRYKESNYKLCNLLSLLVPRDILGNSATYIYIQCL